VNFNKRNHVSDLKYQKSEYHKTKHPKNGPMLPFSWR